MPMTGIAPVPGASPQSAPGMSEDQGGPHVGGDFPNPIAVIVTGSAGVPVPNVVVVFTAPAADQSGYFCGKFKAINLTSATATSDQTGIASAGMFTAESAQLTGAFVLVAKWSATDDDHVETDDSASQLGSVA